MNRGDKTIAGAIILISIVSLLFFGVLDSKGGSEAYALIQVDGEPYGTLSLSDYQNVVIEQDGKYNEIVIDASGIYMASASCDNQDCLHQEKISLENLGSRLLGKWIICLPNAVSIEVVEGDG